MRMTYIIFVIILISPQRKRYRSSLIQLNSLVFGLIYLKSAQVCFEYGTDLFAGDGAWCESTRLSAIVGNGESILSRHGWWHRCWFGWQSHNRVNISFMSGVVFERVCRRTSERHMDPEAASCYHNTRTRVLWGSVTTYMECFFFASITRGSAFCDVSTVRYR